MGHLVGRRKQPADHLGEGGHGAAAVHDQTDLDRVLLGPAKDQLYLSRVLAGLVDGGLQIELVLGPDAAEVAELLQGHLDLPDIQGHVGPVVAELSLRGHLDGHPSAPGSADPDPGRVGPGVAEGRGPAGSDPAAPAVVALGLLLEALLEKPPQLVQGQLLELGQLLLVQGQTVDGVLQPVQDLLGDLDVGLDVAEAGHESLIVLVVVGFALDQDGPGQVVEDVDRGERVALVQGLGQGQPLGYGDRNL